MKMHIDGSIVLKVILGRQEKPRWQKLWWLWWSCCYSGSNWDTITTSLLCLFKHEWWHLLPVIDEEIDESYESYELGHHYHLSILDDFIVDSVFAVVSNHPLDPKHDKIHYWSLSFYQVQTTECVNFGNGMVLNVSLFVYLSYVWCLKELLPRYTIRTWMHER